MSNVIKKACNVTEIKNNSNLNTSYVFIKPHAHNNKIIDLIKQKFKDNKIKILSEGSLTGNEINKKKLIDNHYYSIANKASLIKPYDLKPSLEKLKEFKNKFGIEWGKLIKEGKITNALDACDK